MVAAGLSLEREMWGAGAQHVVGLDEVGRGALAGDLVIAAVAIPAPSSGTYGHPPVADSKLLSEARRVELDEQVRSWADGVGVGEVPAVEIDEIGMAAALRVAARRALTQLIDAGVAFDAVLVDGANVWVPGDALPAGCVARCQVKGDMTSVAMASASVVAKVHRDRAMCAAAEEFPDWGFADHKGYGTRAHEVAIRSHGLSPLHRASWSFVERLLGAEEAARLRRGTGGQLALELA